MCPRQESNLHLLIPSIAVPVSVTLPFKLRGLPLTYTSLILYAVRIPFFDLTFFVRGFVDRDPPLAISADQVEFPGIGYLLFSQLIIWVFGGLMLWCEFPIRNCATGRRTPLSATHEKRRCDERNNPFRSLKAHSVLHLPLGLMHEISRSARPSLTASRSSPSFSPPNLVIVHVVLPPITTRVFDLSSTTGDTTT